LHLANTRRWNREHAVYHSLQHINESAALSGIEKMTVIADFLLADECLRDLAGGRNGVVGDALVGYFDGQGAFVLACVARLVQKLVHGIGQRNLLGAGRTAFLEIYHVGP
jgi:hypothetical protein